MNKREQLVQRLLKDAGTNARLAAALVRVARDDDLRRQVTG